MKQRILYVADSLMAGGIESQLVALALGLDRAHFEPHVLSLYGPRARDLRYAPTLREAAIPIYLPDLGWSAREKLRGIAAIVRTAHAIHPHVIQAEGYHANLLTRLAWPFLPRSASLFGTLRGVNSPKQMRYERLSAWMCSRIIVNAPHLGTDLAKRGHVAPRKIIYIPNGIDIQRFSHPPHDPQLRASLAPDARRVFVSLGRISFEKNMHWLVEAFGLLKRRGQLASDVRLFIVGPPHHQEAEQLLQQSIARYDLKDPVILHPATPYPEDYYAACDAAVLFSPNEGMPNVPLEAMAAGKPVVISDGANAAAVVDHGATGWVVPTGDTAALAETLRQVIDLPDTALAAMAGACQEQAAKYSIANLVERYSGLYRSLRCP
jgi:glycosyltransferase involved in cell wall biosynthesis